MSKRKVASAIRYITLAVLTSLTTWLDQIGAKPIAQVEWSEWSSMALGAATAGLVAWGALLNSSFNAPMNPTVQEPAK